MAIMTGGCACGKVRFEAEGEPGRVGICHCLDCRKYHGAPFHASAIYRDHQVTIRHEDWLPAFPVAHRYERDRPEEGRGEE